MMKHAIKVPFGFWLSGLAVLFALTPYVFPDAPWLHAGNYGSLLLLCLVGVGREIYVRLYGSMRADAQFHETIAMTGGGLLLVSALITALLDPDNQVLPGAPGTTPEIPNVRAHAQFATTQALTPGELTVHIVPNYGAPFDVTGNRRRIFEHSLLYVRAVPSAVVAAKTPAGETLTVTRPSGGGFLAPLLVFRDHTAIADQRLPTDYVAVPAQNLKVLGFLIDAAAAKTDHFSKVSNGRAGIIFDVDAGTHNAAHAIGFAPDGISTRIGPLELKSTLGYYPTLVVSSVPMPILVLLGIFGIVSGWGTLYIRRTRA